MSAPIEVLRTHTPVACSMPACSESAVVAIRFGADHDMERAWTAGLCREHARAHAREILQHVHGVEGLPQRPLPASQRGFGG